MMMAKVLSRCEPPVFVAADGGVFGTMPSTITWLFGQQFAGGIHGALSAMLLLLDQMMVTMCMSDESSFADKPLL